jgi:hypothetical protein
MTTAGTRVRRSWSSGRRRDDERRGREEPPDPAHDTRAAQVTDVVLAYAPVGAGCAAAGSYQPTLVPGEEFTVCVTVTVRIPLLPEFIDANTATGQFVVERDRYVDP